MEDNILSIQESLLKDINKDILLTNNNLKLSNMGVIHQGKKILKVQDKIERIGINLHQTNNTMILIERRSKLYKCSLYVIIILEFITIIIILIRKLIKLFK